MNKTNPTPTQQETLELLPCPFCGQTPELGTGVLKMFRVTCRAAACKVWPTTPWYREEKVVISVWNVRAAVAGPRGDAIRDLFDLLEKDSQGQWNFKSLSRDATKFQSIIERFAKAYPHALDPARVFVEAAFSYLNSISNSTICTDRSCIRCRIADVAFEIERTFSTATSSPTPAESDSCSHWREGDSDHCVWCGDDLGPTTEADVAAPAERTREVFDAGFAAAPADAELLLPVVAKAAKEPCRYYVRGCPESQPDESYWCAPCSARRALATTTTKGDR